MRIWFKIFKDNHLLKDVTFEDYSEDTRTHKIFKGLDYACQTFDLAHPQWLTAVVNDFKKHAKARFNADCFIEEIDFDFMEIHVIEEDV